LSSVQIPNLPAAIALNGSELLEAVQAGTSVRVTTRQIANLASLIGNVLNIRDFGAVGDGVTNDAPAIQSAINAAATATGTRSVFVPHSPQGYALAATLRLPDGVTICGENMWGGERSRLKPVSGFTAPLIETDDYGVTRKLRVQIAGLFLDGSSTTLTACRLNCQESLIRDVTVKNCFTYGLHIGGVGSGATQQALNNHIVDCYFAGSGTARFYDGVFLDYNTADTTIRSVYVEACNNASIRSRAYNDIFIGNHFYDTVYGLYSETSCDKVYVGNYIEFCSKNAILFNGGAGDALTLNASLVGNVLRNIDTGNTENGAITFQGVNISSISATGNVVRRDAATSHSTQYMLFFNGVTPTNTSVQGNFWQSNVVTVGETNLAAGTVLGATNAADDAAAAALGVPIGGVYRTASVLKIRVA
jgi:hypothetical protein